MIDGIIQEVLNPEIKFWSEQKSRCADILATELSRMRQELIEKIRQEFPICKNRCEHGEFLCPNYTNQKQLIGDNQE